MEVGEGTHGLLSGARGLRGWGKQPSFAHSDGKDYLRVLVPGNFVGAPTAGATGPHCLSSLMDRYSEPMVPGYEVQVNTSPTFADSTNVLTLPGCTRVIT